MRKRRNHIAQLDTDLARNLLGERDKWCCFLCWHQNRIANYRVEVHEIVSRSAFGSERLDVCFNIKNRVLLCHEHHSQAQGNMTQIRLLLSLLTKTYGYTYEEKEFFAFT